jgi:hypothetical protein
MSSCADVLVVDSFLDEVKQRIQNQLSFDRCEELVDVTSVRNVIRFMDSGDDSLPIIHSSTVNHDDRYKTYNGVELVIPRVFISSERTAKIEAIADAILIVMRENNPEAYVVYHLRRYICSLDTTIRVIVIIHFFTIN